MQNEKDFFYHYNEFENILGFVKVFRSATENIHGAITSKGSKVLIGYCSTCDRQKSMTVIVNTIEAEGLGDFFKNLGKKRFNVSKMMKKKRFKQSNKRFTYYSNYCYSGSE